MKRNTMIKDKAFQKQVWYDILEKAEEELKYNPTEDLNVLENIATSVDELNNMKRIFCHYEDEPKLVKFDFEKCAKLEELKESDEVETHSRSQRSGSLMSYTGFSSSFITRSEFGSVMFSRSYSTNMSDIFSVIRKDDFALQYEQEFEEEQDEVDEDDDLFVHPPTPPPEKVEDPWIDRRTPYQKLFALPEREAVRWRPDYEETRRSDSLTVQEKENELYKLIANEFCHWLAECEFKSNTLSEAVILDLFRVGTDNPATKAMCVDCKELPAVPLNIAQVLGLPEQSELVGVRKQAYWDVESQGRKEKNYVNQWSTGVISGCMKSYPDDEGKKIIRKGCLDIEKKTEKKKSKSETVKEKWFSTTLIRDEYTHGVELWKKLEKSRYFSKFCDFMSERAQHLQPKYLRDLGHFNNRQIGPKIDPITFKELVQFRNTYSSGPTNYDLTELIQDNSFKGLIYCLKQKIPALERINDIMNIVEAEVDCHMLATSNLVSEETLPSSSNTLSELSTD